MSNGIGSKTMAAVALSGLLAATLLTTSAFAQYPPQGDDITPSIAILIVWVEPPFRSYVSGEQGWEADYPNHWTSAVLQDPNTRIGRSAQFLDGASPLPVGSAGTPVDYPFPYVPTVGFTDGPASTLQIYTELRELQLAGTTCPCGNQSTAPITVLAGVDAGVPASGPLGNRTSWGQVEDLPFGGAGFPAESFFDVFVEIDLTNLGLGVLYNPVTDPLVVVNNNVTTLPPAVSYIHGETSAVPVYFKPGGPFAGQRFGFLRLAGHKPETFCGGDAFAPSTTGDQDCTNPSPACANVCGFINEVKSAPLMPCPQCVDAVTAAEPEFTFRGVVTFVSSGGPHGDCAPPFDNIQVGDPWSVTYCFDPNAPDSFPSPVLGDYEAISSYRLQIGTAIDSSVSPVGDFIRVFSNQPPPYDQYEVSLNLTNGDSWFMELDDSTGQAFTSDALKLCGEIDPAAFDIKDFYLFGGGGPGGCQVFGTVDSHSCGACDPCGPDAGECTDPPSDMVSWWRGDDCGAADSVGANNGTFSGVPFCPSSWKVGGGALGISTAGPTYVTVPDHPTLRFADGDFSIDLWIKTPGDGPILQKGLTSGPGFGLEVLGGLVRFQACDTNICINPPSSVTTVTDNVWHHVTATVAAGDGDRIFSLYVDGTLEGAQNVDFGSLDSPDPLRFGASGPLAFPTNVLNGALDEIEIFRRALQPSEIQALVDAGCAGKCKCVPPPSGMLGWWPLDESVGLVARDIAGAHHATHVGSPGPIHESNGKVSGALGGLDGNNHLTTAGAPFNFGSSTGFTIDAWVYRSGTSGELWIVDRDHDFHFAANSLSGSPPHLEYAPCGVAFWPSGALVPLNVWTHLAVTVAPPPGVVSKYLNGVLVGTQATCGGYNASYGTTPLGIGGGTGGAGEDRRVDEVEIFNRVLSPAEIEQLYLADRTGKCKNRRCMVGGVSDDYSTLNGPEPASPSLGMQIRYPNRRDFDQTGLDRLLGHTFDLSAVKGCMLGGTYDFQARPMCGGESNDAAGLFFINNLGNVVPSSSSWARRLGVGAPDPGLQPNPWSCGDATLTASTAWPFGPFDLRFLPTAAGGSVDVINDMNLNGWIDAYAQDDTEVDYMNLCVNTEPNCCPGSGTVTSPLAFGIGGGNLNISWLPSCESSDSDYEVYAGTLPLPGNLFVYNHAPVMCSTGGALSVSIPIGPGNQYYLVVPRNGCREGSYGKDWNGIERPQGSPFCMTKDVSCP